MGNEGQPGTWREEDGTRVEFADALDAWVPVGTSVLIGVAGTYGETITYKDLAERLWSETGIRTRSLLPNWIGDVLNRVSAEQPHGQPLLTSLVVDAEGRVGPGYEVPVRRAEGGSPEDLQMHAAHTRLECYRAFGAELPSDGGRPQLTPQVRAARERSSPTKRAVCCDMVVPLSGECGVCGTQVG